MEYPNIQLLVSYEYCVLFKKQELKFVKEDDEHIYYVYKVLWKNYPVKYIKHKNTFTRMDVNGYYEYDHMRCDDVFA